MTTVTKYDSPDHALTFEVVCDDQDITLGFTGYPWHTHGDILAATSGLPIDAAIEHYVERLLSDQMTICTETIDGFIRDIWIADNPVKRDPYRASNEKISYRLWGGRLIEAP